MALGIYLEQDHGAIELGGREPICWGYWQGECYFLDARNEVRSKFKFPEVLVDHGSLAKGTQGQSIAVHIRRGDYVSDPESSSLHLVCDSQWYARAIGTMKEKIPDARFILFSDDLSWALRELGHLDSVEVIPNEQPSNAWRDMALMSQCNHFILSNSSYSWWAWYLGKARGSVALAPKFWYRGRETRSLPIYSAEWELL